MYQTHSPATGFHFLSSGTFLQNNTSFVPQPCPFPVIQQGLLQGPSCCQQDVTPQNVCLGVKSFSAPFSFLTCYLQYYALQVVRPESHTETGLFPLTQELLQEPIYSLQLFPATEYRTMRFWYFNLLIKH